MSDFSDNKVVSIEFDNQQFEKDVSKTINTIDELDKATSSKNLHGEGLENLSAAFSNLNKNATQDIDQINSKLADTSSYDKLSESVSGVNQEFSTLQIIGIGALLAIGETAIHVGSQIANTLTAGIRDGWSEYNLIMDSTQTILANTQRYGTTLDDVTGALDVLNEYADKTIYNFSQMTRNIGLFTTAGMNLEDSVTAIKGMSNLGAVFGADNAAMARATYQMSQAMSSGYVKLRDWMSMENAGMGGKLLQEELIRTAAVMSGQSVDAFKEYIGYSKGFRNTLEANWLTADVFMETMRKYAGESREYWESLKAADGSRLYTDEEIDELMQIAASAEEAATKVRTFKMMVESLMESIGSGWSETFRLLIGDLEEAKEFWTPINDLLSSIVNGVSDYRNTLIKSWRDVYREAAIEDMMTALRAIGDILGAIGNGIARAFGSTHNLAGNIGRVTEAIGDLATTMTLTDEELEMLSYFVEGLISPLTLFGDLIYDIARTFFNASDAMNEFDERGESLADQMQGIRGLFFNVLGAIGAFGKKITEVIRDSGIISKAVTIFSKAIKGLYDITYSFLTWIGPILENLLVNYLIPFLGLFAELGAVSWQWLQNLGDRLRELDINILEDLRNILNGLYNVFHALIDPTEDVRVAWEQFNTTLRNTSIASILATIRDSLDGLWDSLKNTHLFQYFISLFEQFKQSDFGVWLLDIVNKLREVISTVFGNFSNIGNGGGFLSILQTIIDKLIGLKNQIAGLGIIDSAIVILKSIFETIGGFISSVVNGIWGSIGSLEFDTNVETIVMRLIRAVEALLVLGAVFAAANLPRLFARTAHNIIFQIFDPISDMFMVVKERFKRDTWQVLGDFFKSLAIFVGVMAASILVLASLKDPYIALPLLITMFAGIAAIVGIITSGINNMFDSIRNSGLSGVTQSFALVMALSQVSTILAEIITFIGLISALAFLYSRADEDSKSAIAIAFGAMVATFALISSMMIILTERLTNNFSVLSGLDSGLRSATRTFMTIINSLVKIVAVIGVMAAVLMLASGGDSSAILSSVLSLILSVGLLSFLAVYLLGVAKTMRDVTPDEIATITIAIDSLTTAFLIISAAISILARVGGSAENIAAAALSLILSVSMVSMLAAVLMKFVDTLSFTSGNALAQLEGFIVLLSAVGLILAYTLKMMLTEEPSRIMEATLALLFIVGSFSLLAFKLTEFASTLAAVNFGDIAKIAASMAIMIGSLFMILLALKKLDDIIKESSLDSVETSLILLGAVLLGMMAVLAALSYLQNTGLLRSQGMLGIASSMLILSGSLIPIALSISMIAAIDVGDGSKAIKAATSIAIVMGTMALVLGGVSTLWDVLKVNALYIAGAVAAFVILSQSLVTIAGALAIVGAIPDVKGAVDSISRIMLGIGAFLAVFGLFGALTEGIGPAILLAVAGAFIVMAGGLVLIAKAVMLMGMAMNLAGTGTKAFAEAMKMIEAIDTDKLLSNFVAMANFFPIMASSIMANKDAIMAAIVILFRSVGYGIVEAIKIIFNTIGTVIIEGFAEQVRVVLGLVVELFDILMTTLHSLLVILNDFLKKEIGPGGVLRELAITLSDFILWLAEFLGGFIFTAITKLIESVAEALENDGVITRLFNAIKHLMLSVKLALYNWLGVASLGEWISQIMLGLIGMIVDGLFAAGQFIVNGLNDITEEITGSRSETLDRLYDSLSTGQTNALVNMGNIFGNYQSASIAEVEAELSALEDETDRLNSVLDAEEARQRAIDAEGDTSVYNPSRYYAAAAGVEDWNNQLSETPSLLDGISSALGGSGGLGGIISSIFGTNSSSGGGFLSNLFGGDSAFSASGESSAESWTDGFSSVLNSDSNGLTSMSNMDFSNLDSISNVDFSNFNTGLETANLGMDELSNPVITPVVDDTEYNLGLNRMEDTWNAHHFDQFALDVGNSMTLREQAEGDATTDGNVSYNFTQNNYSNQDLTRTEVYLDSRNLLRGSGLFVAR